MKTVAKLLGILVLVLLAVPLMRYHTVDPCRMLEKELVSQAEREVREARDSVQAALSGLSDSARETTDHIASAVQNVAVGVAAGLARTKVENMSRRECVAEIWRVTVKDR